MLMADLAVLGHRQPRQRTGNLSNRPKHIYYSRFLIEVGFTNPFKPNC